MSTTIQTLEKQIIANKTIEKMKEDKSQRFVRTSSIDKIRQFNTYLCTQHYYIVPAILAWLKSSQDVLHSSAEKTILYLRSLILNTVIYRLIHLDYKSISYRNILESVKNVYSSYKLYLFQVYVDYQLEARFLKCIVYLTGTILFSQLIFCMVVMFSTHVPLGLLFLLVCVFYIIHLYYRATLFFLSNEMKKKVK